jgi:hypothetical protein
MNFEVGQTYSTRSIGDHNCIIRVTIARRTAKTVTTTEGKTFRVGAYYRDGHEMIRPWGNHSMCPIITAEDTRELRPDWERDACTEDDRPMAAEGLISYRCKGAFGWIMIGASDNEDAFREAIRSSSRAQRDSLEVWNNGRYVKAQS